MLIYANKWPLFPFIPALKQSVFTPISKNKTSAIEVIAQKEGVRVHVQKKKRKPDRKFLHKKRTHCLGTSKRQMKMTNTTSYVLFQ